MASVRVDSPLTIDELVVREYTSNDHDAALGIFCADELVGGAGLNDRTEPNDVELSYWVDAEWQGRGIATRVAKALTDYAFRFPEVHRVVVRHLTSNAKSRRIPEKLGFLQIPELPDCDCGGTAHTNWAVTRAQWIAREGVAL